MEKIFTPKKHKSGIRPYFRHLLAALILLATVSVTNGQISMEKLLEMSTNGRKFDQEIRRLGFKDLGLQTIRDSACSVYALASLSSKDVQQILKFRLPDCDLMAYQFMFPGHKAELESELAAAGFDYPTTNRKSYAPCLYQKGNAVVSFAAEPSDSGILYTCYIQHRALPKLKDMVYAEDLLQLTSHAYLVSVFGEQNVRKDYFYFSETKKVPCSVLFPNTKLEAVFVWQDAVNYRDILSLRIGGDPQTQSSLEHDEAVAQNVWRSRKGLYIGMSLQELQQRSGINDQDIIGSEGFKQKATANDENPQNLGIIFSCLNCETSKYFTANYANRSDLEEDGRKVFISTMVFSSPGR